MEKQVIKTYSRREPVAQYKSSAVWVPNFPNPEAHSDVRESRLHEKTIQVDVFEDTFDKIATEVNSRPPRKYDGTSSIDREDSDNSSSNDESYPTPTRAEEKERKGMHDEFWEQENLKLNENFERTKQNYKKGVVEKGIKRKKLAKRSSDEDDDSEKNQQNIKLSKFKRPKQAKNIVTRKKKATPDNEEVQEVGYTSENKLSILKDSLLDSSVRIDDTSTAIANELQISKDTRNIGQRKFPHIFPTSTPKDQKQKLIVNVQKLSPITLNKENLLVTDIEPISADKQVLRDANLSVATSQTSLQSERNIQSISNGSNPSKVTLNQRRISEEVIDNNEMNRDKNNSIMHDLLVANVNVNSTEKKQDNSILKSMSIPQSNNKKQSIVSSIEQSHNTISRFVESPLLFNDTDMQQSEKDKNCSALSTNSNSVPQELKKESDKKSNKPDLINVNKELKNTSYKNFDESSFSPHEWSNEYDSSYEYFSNKNKSVIDKTTCTTESKLESISKNNIIHNDSMSINKELSEKFKLDENGISEQRSNSNCKKNPHDSTCDKSLGNVVIKNSYEIDNNSNSNSFELRIESNSSNAKEDSPIFKDQRIEKIPTVTKSITNLSEDQIRDVLNKSDENSMILKDQQTSKVTFVENQLDDQNTDVPNERKENTSQCKGQISFTPNGSKENYYISKDQRSLKFPEIMKSVEIQSQDQITDVFDETNKICSTYEKPQQNIVNHKKQINQCSEPLIINEITDKKELIKNDDDINVRLNGRNLMICLTRLSPDLYKPSPILSFRTSKRKQSKVKVPKDKTKETASNKNNQFKNSDDQKAINNSINSKLDKSFRNKSSIQSGRIEKNKTHKTILKKKTRTSRKKKESCKNYAKEIVENMILNKETESKKNVYNYNELCQSFKIKDSYVLVHKLQDSDIANKTSTSMKKNTRETMKRKLSINSKSVNKHRDEDKSENESIIKIADKSIGKMGVDQESNNHSSIEQKVATSNQQNSYENINKLNASVEELCDILTKLKDPVKITVRKNSYKKLERPLAAVTENFAEQPSCIEEEEEEEEEEKEEQQQQNKKNNIKSRQTNNNLLTDTSIEVSEANTVEDQNHPIFLKPGKSWARSLSIINHFHSGQNLDQLSAGRGKNWRHSVQTILNMQPEVNTQVIAKKNSEDKDEQSRFSNMPIIIRRESTSPPRFSRFSIRIIPDGKRSTLTGNFSLLQESSSISNRTRKTSLARKSSLKNRRDTLIQTEEDLIKSAKDIILKRCKQTFYLKFSDSFPDSYIQHCRKIGEGVYGEVFLYQNESEKSVIKIIPIEGDELVNCEPQKKFHEILSEIIISEELHKLKFEGEYITNGFVGINRIMCVIGKYPEKLINLWNAYDNEKNSENDCPSMFNDDQLYIILELAHGGQDLEAYVFQNASESYSIFLQTAYTLAVAEQSLEFEHRDLHWGNLLISKTDKNEIVYKLGSKEISINSKGVKVSVIDFTLSRMSYQGCKIFNDLAADPTLFTAQGEYQFDIYRMMRSSVNNEWQQFNPYTNVLWLDYTLDKMVSGARYKRKNSKLHKNAIEWMKKIRKEILNYKSAFDFVSNCEKITSEAKT